MSFTILLMTIIIVLLLTKVWRQQKAAITRQCDDGSLFDPQFNNLANAICEGFFEANLITGAYQVSESWAQTTGYTQQELPAKFPDMITMVVHPADAAKVMTSVSKPSATGERTKFTHVVRIRHANGHWLWIRGLGRVFYDEKGKPERIIASHANITKVKQAEQALRNSQILAGLRAYRYDPIAESVSLGPNTHSNSLLRAVPEWIEMPAANIIHPDDLTSVVQALGEADQNDHLELEFRVVNADGATGYVVIYGDIETDANGKFTAINGVFRDITQQKRSESRFIEFGKLLDGSRTGLVLTHIDNHEMVYANQKYYADSGYSVEEIVGKHCTTIVPDWNDDQITRLFAMLRRKQHDTKKWYYQSEKMGRKNGGAYPADIWIQVTEWEGQTVIATMILDISDRAEAQQALALSEQKYRRIFDALPDGICLFKENDQTVIDCNQELARSHGWTLEEIMGQPISMFISERNALFQDKAVTELSTATGKVITESLNIRKDKSEFPVEAHLKAITINQEPYIVTVVRDVTERHRYIKELKQQKADIEQFTYSISHDLKSPLVTIEGFSEILSDNLANNDIDHAQKDLRRINLAAVKMHNLLTELLDFSRLGLTIQPTKTMAMTKIINEALARTSVQINDANVNISIGTELPEVTGNPERLTQLYQSLIDNAIKFGGQEKPIEILFDWDVEKGHFFVDDNGTGIAPQFQDRVFVLFNQLDPGQAGSGIGLAAVKRIIEAHGGRAWIESPSPMGGTRICFSLPSE